MIFLNIVRLYIFDKFIKKMEQVMKKIILSIMLTLIMGACNMNNSEKQTEIWDKTFKQSDNVSVEKVYFKNRYGITLAGDLYIPKNIDKSKKYPAVAVSGPFGAVKEQASGLYAQNMAERGFIAMAFDASYTGESSGEPRNTASPDINTEDFSAAVDFLSNYEYADAEKIGIIGICGFGGFGLNQVSDKKDWDFIKKYQKATQWLYVENLLQKEGDNHD